MELVVFFFPDGCTFLEKQNLENCIDFNVPIYKGFIPIVEY